MDWLEEYYQRERDRRKMLNEKYPTKEIQNINIEHLKKIGYAIGLGAKLGKRECIHQILLLQYSENKIITYGINGYCLNERCRLMEYIVK